MSLLEGRISESLNQAYVKNTYGTQNVQAHAVHSTLKSISTRIARLNSILEIIIRYTT